MCQADKSHNPQRFHEIQQILLADSSCLCREDMKSFDFWESTRSKSLCWIEAIRRPLASVFLLGPISTASPASQKDWPSWSFPGDQWPLEIFVSSPNSLTYRCILQLWLFDDSPQPIHLDRAPAAAGVWGQVQQKSHLEATSKTAPGWWLWSTWKQYKSANSWVYDCSWDGYVALSLKGLKHLETPWNILKSSIRDLHAFHDGNVFRPAFCNTHSNWKSVRGWPWITCDGANMLAMVITLG